MWIFYWIEVHHRNYIESKEYISIYLDFWRTSECDRPKLVEMLRLSRRRCAKAGITYMAKSFSINRNLLIFIILGGSSKMLNWMLLFRRLPNCDNIPAKLNIYTIILWECQATFGIESVGTAALEAGDSLNASEIVKVTWPLARSFRADAPHPFVYEATQTCFGLVYLYGDRCRYV